MVIAAEGISAGDNTQPLRQVQLLFADSGNAKTVYASNGRPSLSRVIPLIDIAGSQLETEGRLARLNGRVTL